MLHLLLELRSLLLTKQRDGPWLHMRPTARPWPTQRTP